MPEFWAGGLGEFRATSTAGGGTALTTTAGYIQFPALPVDAFPPTRKLHVFVTPRNFATAVVAKVTFNPWLTILKTEDGMKTKPTDYSVVAQDNSTDTSVVLTSLNTEANGDFVLLGSHIPFRGFQCDVDGTNATATTTATLYYWDGTGWTSLSATDGTKSSTALDQDGLIYWTVPTAPAWVSERFKIIFPQMTQNTYYSDIPLYWVKWVFDKQLDTTEVTIDSITAANRSTAYGELISGQTLEQRITHGFGGVGCIEALTNAGTANLIVNVAPDTSGEF